MLHFCPIEPLGHVVSVPPSTVHFCEHTGVGSWLNVFVQTWLVHSVDVSLTVVHEAPNAPPPAGLSMAASALGASPDVQAATPSQMRVQIAMRFMSKAP